MLDGPLYLSVRDALIQRLAERVWRAGALVPPEPRLAGEFGCSIGTLRKAIDGLCDDGALVRRQGSGTYVRDLGPGDPAETLVGLRDRQGGIVAPMVLRQLAGLEGAMPAAEEALRLEKGATVLRADRLFHVDGKTRLHETLSVSAEHLDDFDPSAPLPVWFHPYLQDHHGMFIVSQRPCVGMVRADGHIARCLKVGEGTSLFRIETVGYNLRGEPVEHRLAHVPSDGLTYRPSHA